MTLLEVIVVIGILGMLISLLLPAVQMAREAGRRSHCQNNLRQIGLALQLYESAYSRLPPGGFYAVGTVQADSYSVHARILPYLEQTSSFLLLDFGLPATSQPQVVMQRIPVYVCPSEINDVARNSVPVRYPTTYACNVGTWFVWDPSTGRGGDGVFAMNACLRLSDIRDGTSNTIGFAEVKAYQSYLLGTGQPNAFPVPPPASVAATIAYGGSLKVAVGHTGWTEGQTFQTGFTFVHCPNTFVSYTDASGTYDVDYISSREGSSASAYSYDAATSRSYHPGGTVSVLFMDGSVRCVATWVDLMVWRAMGTPRGSEAGGV